MTTPTRVCTAPAGGVTNPDNTLKNVKTLTSWNWLCPSFGPRPANVVADLGAAERVVFVTDEVRDWRQLAANRPWRYRTVWGRMEDVNWDYYPTWEGHPRVLEVSASDREAVAR